MKLFKKYWWVLVLILIIAAIVIIPSVKESSFGAVHPVASSSAERLIQ